MPVLTVVAASGLQHVPDELCRREEGTVDHWPGGVGDAYASAAAGRACHDSPAR
jgi:hypothetical protein